MSSKKKPVFRLTVIFISAVVASGSILAYLSINNISNLKELTEKRVLEEQKNLAHFISTDIQDEISEVATRFPEAVTENIKDDLTAIKLFDTNDLVRNSFVINEDGEFLWPWFEDKLEPKTEKNSSGRFKKNFSQAENSEFLQKNFHTSNQFYLASLRASISISDSVKSLNALARLSVKMKDTQQALNYYSNINSKYFSVCLLYTSPSPRDRS